MASEKIQGKLEVQDNAGTKTRVSLDGNFGRAQLGGEGKDGQLFLQEKNGRLTAALYSGKRPPLRAGETPKNVEIVGIPASITLYDEGKLRIRLNSSDAGPHHTPGGTMQLCNIAGKYTLYLNGLHGLIQAGGNGAAGVLSLLGVDGKGGVFLAAATATIKAGSTIVLNGNAGTIH